jgi:hypothetical protein
MQMTNAILGILSLAKNTFLAATIGVAPSALIKSAHLIGRIGLATLGSSSSLYVAAALMRRGNELFESGWIVLLMMLYGAFGFYVGIDLPGRPVQRSTPTLPGEWKSGTDAAEIFGPAGTFLAAIAAFLSVSVIILDAVVPDGLIALVGCCWAIGSSLQIAAGAVARQLRNGPG